MPSTDLRAFLVVVLVTCGVAGGLAFWSARWVVPKPIEGSARPVLLTFLGLAMALAGVWLAWVATNSTLFALSRVATGMVIVVGLLALGAAVATAVKRPEWMGRRTVAAVVAGGLLVALNGALLATQVPFSIRFNRSLDTVSLQAQQTWEDPPPSLRSDGVTPRSDPTVIDQLGDFPVSQVALTDCGPDFTREGLSFSLGESATTALVWCQLGRPSTDARAWLRHLDGAWYLVWEA